MSQLLESLKLKDGQIQNLKFHQDRLSRTMEEFYPNAEKINLQQEISVPEHCSSGIFKIRVLYGQTIEKIEIEPYVFRTIKSLRVVHHESIDYHLKFTDRQILQDLFARRGECDDIIIVKEDFVTDSFAANLLFFDGANWVTPTTPLLKGTKRWFLLEQGIISEKEIREEEIKSFQKVGLVNAMIDFEEMPIVPVAQVF
jgi:4-amino-4-deoxychorismate lyase